MPKPRLSDAQVRDALTQAGGVVARAARLLGITKASLYERVRRSPELKALSKKRARVTTNEILAALRQSAGFPHSAAHALHCSPNTIYNRGREDPEVAAAIEEPKERRKDLAEGTLFAAMRQRDKLGLVTREGVTSAIFYLKTQARDRGYIERMEHGGSIQVDEIGNAAELFLGRLVRLAARLRAEADAGGNGHEGPGGAPIRLALLGKAGAAPADG